jgi:hypothetical protein
MKPRCKQAYKHILHRAHTHVALQEERRQKVANFQRKEKLAILDKLDSLQPIDRGDNKNAEPQQLSKKVRIGLPNSDMRH